MNTIVIIRTATGEIADAAPTFEAADRSALALAEMFNTPFHCREATEAEVDYLRQTQRAST